MKSQVNRLAFTLVELMVVLGIVGVLLALLLPAVQRVRESARRVTCENNLRQLGMAIQSHEASLRKIPSLYNGTFLPRPKTQQDEFHFHSWRTAILPQLELTSLHDKIDFDVAATALSNQGNLNVSLPVFVCPSTSNETPVIPQVYAYNDGDDPAVIAGTAARSDYEANLGYWTGASLRSPRGEFDHLMLGNVASGAFGLPDYDQATGEYIDVQQIRFSDMTDGLSNTILVVERAGRPDNYRNGKLYIRGGEDDPFWDPIADSASAAWGRSTRFNLLVQSSTNGVNDTNRSIYSFHGTGANVVMADGSVHFLSNTIDQKILLALLTSHGGELESLP